jgi:hypothetical protein
MIFGADRQIHFAKAALPRYAFNLCQQQLAKA